MIEGILSILALIVSFYLAAWLVVGLSSALGRMMGLIIGIAIFLFIAGRISIGT